MSPALAAAGSLKRRAALAATVVIAAMAGSAAHALPAHAYAIGLDHASYTYGDCALNVGMMRWDTGAWVTAYGQASCTLRKTRTAVTVTLKKNSGAESIANTTTFLNSFGMGTRWLWTAWSSGCANYQAVMHVDIAGFAPTYVTTGAPIAVCNRSSKPASQPRALPKRATNHAPA
jgi:hypothetical protein